MAKRSWLPSGMAAVMVAFVVLVVIGGSNAVAVRLSNLELPPFWGAGIRFGAAALIFWLIVLVRRVALPRGRALAGALLYGLLSVGTSYALLYWGLQRVPANLTMVVLALVPLLTIFLAWVHRLERLSWRRLAGAVVALTGILIVVGGGLNTGLPILSFLALVGAAVCIAEAGVAFKLFPPIHPVVLNALSLTTGSSVLIGLSLLAGEDWVLPAEASTWAAFVYLVALGSVALSLLYIYVLTRWTASATAYSFLLFPVATVPIAALVAGEAITVSFIVGGAIGLLGVWFGAISGSAPVPAADAPLTTD